MYLVPLSIKVTKYRDPQKDSVSETPHISKRVIFTAFLALSRFPCNGMRFKFSVIQASHVFFISSPILSKKSKKFQNPWSIYNF